MYAFELTRALTCGGTLGVWMRGTLVLEIRYFLLRSGLVNARDIAVAAVALTHGCLGPTAARRGHAEVLWELPLSWSAR